MGLLAQEIYQEAQTLPQALEQEVLDYIGYLKSKYAISEMPANEQFDDLQKAQARALNEVWDNEYDNIWDQIE